VTDALKLYVEKKVERFKKYDNHLIEAHITLGLEKYRQVAEVSIFGKRLKITETKVDTDMYTAIDAVCSVIEKTLRRRKERIKDHKVKNPNKEISEE